MSPFKTDIILIILQIKIIIIENNLCILDFRIMNHKFIGGNNIFQNNFS